MFKLLILACSTWALAASQQQSFDYFYDYVDAPADLQQQPVARPPPVQQPARARAPAPPRARAPPPPRTRPQGRPTAEQDPLLDGERTTPVPILIDSRSIDTKTGAFVYQYKGADGSEKHEFRYPNGTVVGNFTFINDLGERETRVYSAGVHDPNLVDETTDPNYVDLGNYELYKHLEQPYIHQGPSGSFRDVPARQSAQPARQNAQPARPRAQGRPASRPASRPAPRPAPGPQPAPATFQAPAAPPRHASNAVAHFSQPPLAGPVFDYEDIPLAAAPPPQRPAPAAPRPPPQGQSSRGRAEGRPRPQAAPRPRHRLDFANTANSPQPQSSDSFLDALIRRFQ